MSTAYYEFLGEGTCRACEKSILWWLTPRGKRMPVDDCPEVLPEGPLLTKGERWDDPADIRRLLKKAHWATCPGSKQFRGKCRLCEKESARAALKDGLCKRCRKAAAR